MEPTGSSLAKGTWRRAVRAGAAMLAAVVLFPLASVAQTTGKAHTPGSVHFFTNQFTVKIANLGDTAVDGFVVVLDPLGLITSKQPFNVAPSRIIDVVAPAVAGQSSAPIVFVPGATAAGCRLYLDVFQTDTMANIVQVPNRHWMEREDSVLEATTVLFGPRRMGHFEFNNTIADYSPGPIKSSQSFATLYVFNYGAAAVALQTACMNPSGQGVVGCQEQTTIPPHMTEVITYTGLPVDFYPLVRVVPATVMTTLLVRQANGIGQQFNNGDWRRLRAE
jgi:hypothetical protein